MFTNKCRLKLHPVSAIYKRVLSIHVRSQAMTVRLYSERFECQTFDIDIAKICRSLGLTFAILDNAFCQIDYFSNKVGAIS